MKFARKMTLTLLILLSAALAAVGLAMVSLSFGTELARTKSSCAAQQLKDEYALETAILTQWQGNATLPGGAENGYDAALLAGVARHYAGQLQGSTMALYANGQNCLYTNLPKSVTPICRQKAVAAGRASTTILPAEGGTLLLAVPLNIPGENLVLLTAYNIHNVFAGRNALLTAWLAATAAVLVVAALLAQRLSGKLTAPLETLEKESRKIAAGEYAGRTGVETDDEIGALSRSFDEMAAAVETKVAALALSVQQQKDFVGAFTHEIKTPMTSMLGYADLLRAHPQNVAAQKQAADYIYHETKRLEELSRKLLALLGLDAAGMENAIARQPVRDKVLFAQVERSLARPQNDAVPVRFLPGGCTVVGDRALLADLLRNLVLNGCAACRDMPEGQGMVTVQCSPQKGRAIFTVQDNGCGIPAGELPRITEPFYMVDKSRARAGGGSGIGLALAKRIAELHRATLEFTSAANQGTTVRFCLLLASDHVEKGGTGDETNA